MKWTDQEVPKPEGPYQGQPENHDALLTGQDGRLGYEPGTGDITTLEQLKAMRNLRDV